MREGIAVSDLTQLPNVGPVLAENLRKIGIDRPEQLRELGAKEAWLRIRLQVDGGACLHQLQALEGAVEGIPKKELSPEKKAELKDYFNSIKKGT